MKKYTIKNYKGQLVESLERFTKKYKGMRVVEASEKDGALNIIAEEDDDYEGSSINPDDYVSYANDFEGEVRKVVDDQEKAKNILTATDELASNNYVRAMLLDKFLKDDHDGFISGFAELFGMPRNPEDVKTAWNELVKAQPRAAIMYQLQGVGPEILDDVLEAAGFETGEPLEESNEATGNSVFAVMIHDDDKFKTILGIGSSEKEAQKIIDNAKGWEHVKGNMKIVKLDLNKEIDYSLYGLDFSKK